MAEETITIDGVEHNLDSLSDESKYMISQIQDLQKKAASLRFSLDQIAVAQDVFTQNLVNSLKGDDQEAA